MLRFQNDASLTVKDIHKDIDVFGMIFTSSVVSDNYIIWNDNEELCLSFKHPEACLVTILGKLL